MMDCDTMNKLRIVFVPLIKERLLSCTKRK
jgi:hypothetical protein